MTTSVYYAAPLFSNMERQYNDYLVKQLRQHYPDVAFYVPQEQGDINDKSQYADSKKIAQYDTDALLKSNVMIAVLDGATIDVGVASEIGVAYQAGIPIIGLFSDSRQQGADNQEKITALQEVAESQFPYANLYTIGLIKLNGLVVSTEEAFIGALKHYI
ncbi:nucleoside 2-deoxyribosyltransferase [Vagococcus xieshaowenii]|uniref:Nucleoside 2-deoxyribosyltransferase n=1 Tax=Vagococcus xieshaowenii TaxID=2562451 RepID=A0AAJ5JQ76_9ENTE|nr:nucleoside 2-deoxyribosyltransferase [Vagococcus xieshaowenii]QCA27865.1 nucleoside 2-deoxyribosyltransferase [Vagococcus xieshaowenii]TFZ39455.1 nucleoside 2-deoxyribosyltransferase [Vagococcus xieshaowenii]